MKVLRLFVILSGLTISTPHVVMASPDAMTVEEARHLISRTGFGAAPQEVSALVGRSYAVGVAQLVGGIVTQPTLPMPQWTKDWIYPADQIWTLDQNQIDLFYTNRWQDIEQLAEWWIAEMTVTPSPLTEKLVLLWSDLFANSFDQHEKPHWVAQQNQFLRAHAGGNFADLANGMLRDPAMLTYLNNVSNYPDAPNENLAREFLELFTLGEGRGYTQDDVRAAARMLTGLTVAENGTPRTVFLDKQHDTGEKSIFGTSGDFDAKDLVSLTLAQPDFGPFIIENLWLTFVSDMPDPVEVAALNQLWHDNNLEIAPLLTALLLTDAFWDPANRGRLVKPPVDLLVGTVRTLGIPLADTGDLRMQAAEMGQNLFLPPNVGGWPDGIEWINDATASGRATALTALLDRGTAEVAENANMMMATPHTAASEPVVAGPNDLRIGKVFNTYLERRDSAADGIGGQFVLYDVSFSDHTWRSLPIWFEYHVVDGWTAINIGTDDCAPACFKGMTPDESGAIVYDPNEEFLAANPNITPDDIALLQIIGDHFPEMVQSTLNERVFRYDPARPETRKDNGDVYMDAANAFAIASRKTLGAAKGNLVLQQSAANTLGLGISDAMQVPADMDAYREQAAQIRVIAAVPGVTYENGRDWLNALPGTGPESQRAAAMLLAVPRPADGQRDELIAQDPDALLRSLILSPAYQVN